MREKLIRQGRGALVDLLVVGGAVLVSMGTGLIYFPAGLIAGGLLSLAGAWLVSAGGKGGDDG